MYKKMSLIALGAAFLLSSAMPVFSADSMVLQRIKERGSINMGHRESSVPFSYIGNDKNDLHVWWVAQSGILVNAPKKVEKLAAELTTIDDRLSDQRGIEMIAPHRKGRKKVATQDGRKLRRYRRRWKVERMFAWLQNLRRWLFVTNTMLIIFSVWSNWVVLSYCFGFFEMSSNMWVMVLGYQDFVMSLPL